MICDFCRGESPSWEYPVDGDFELPSGVMSLGPWVSCDRCREFVDDDDRLGLARRCRMRNPELSLDVIQAVQARFFIHQVGEARPIRETPMHGRWFTR